MELCCELRWCQLSMPVQVRKHSAVHDGLAWELCCMLAQQCCAGSPVAQPKQVRAAILEALQVLLPLCAGTFAASVVSTLA